MLELFLATNSLLVYSSQTNLYGQITLAGLDYLIFESKVYGFIR